MNKEELIKEIAQKRHINEAVLKLAYEEIFSTIIQAVADGKAVEIPGFGIFYRTEKHLGRTQMPSKKMIPDFSPDLNFRMTVRDRGVEHE